MPDPKVSLIIRTYNEEKHIGKLLEEISRQTLSFPIETIIVDSGSTDRTLEIVEDFPTRLVRIRSEDFTFGYSLNEGIRHAAGEICLITSAHCYPVDTHWIERMAAPFEAPDVSLVCGRQVGHDVTQYSEKQVFKQWFPEEGGEEEVPFANNANAAIRRSLWEKRPYDETLTGLEDIEWAKFVRSEGMRIVYRADAPVYHIHEENARQTYARYYREALAYKKIYGEEHFGFGSFLKFFLLNTWSDYLHAAWDRQLTSNLLSIPRFRFNQFWATYQAHRYRVPISKAMQKKLYYPVSLDPRKVRHGRVRSRSR